MKKIIITAIGIVFSLLFAAVIPILKEMNKSEITLDVAISVDDYAFINGNNRYGNSLELLQYSNRKFVSNNKKLFGGKFELFQCNLDESELMPISWFN